MSVTKRKRDKPCKPRGVDSRGEHGARRHPLTELQKVLLGKGVARSLASVECRSPWRGSPGPAKPVFDAAQAAENKRLYPHPFEDR